MSIRHIVAFLIRQLYGKVMFFSKYRKLSFTHAKERDILRSYRFFHRQSSDGAFREYATLRKSVKTLTSLFSTRLNPCRRK